MKEPPFCTFFLYPTIEAFFKRKGPVEPRPQDGPGHPCYQGGGGGGAFLRAQDKGRIRRDPLRCRMTTRDDGAFLFLEFRQGHSSERPPSCSPTPRRLSLDQAVAAPGPLRAVAAPGAEGAGLHFTVGCEMSTCKPTPVRSMAARALPARQQ